MTKLVVATFALSLLSLSAHAFSSLKLSHDQQSAVQLQDGVVEYLDLQTGEREVLMQDSRIESADLNSEGQIVLIAGSMSEVYDPLTGSILGVTFDPLTGKTTITLIRTGPKRPRPGRLVD